MVTKTVLATAVLGFLGATSALADHGHHGRGKGHAYRHGYAPAVVYARVVDVEPLVRHVTVNRPREQCWNEVVHEPIRPYGVAGPTASGTIIGAAIGHQFGDGSGQDAMTVLGAVAGGAVAHQRAVRNGAGATRAVTVQRCEVVNDRVTEQIIDGYLVTYRLDGRNYRIETDRHPGNSIAVDVRPVAYRVRS